jgi:hypothetical protein
MDCVQNAEEAPVRLRMSLSREWRERVCSAHVRSDLTWTVTRIHDRSGEWEVRSVTIICDECEQLFIDAMRDLSMDGQTVDLAVWLQWYTFDVIAGLTFQRRFGFLEQRKDVGDVI